MQQMPVGASKIRRNFKFTHHQPPELCEKKKTTPGESYSRTPCPLNPLKCAPPSSMPGIFPMSEPPMVFQFICSPTTAFMPSWSMDGGVKPPNSQELLCSKRIPRWLVEMDEKDWIRHDKTSSLTGEHVGDLAEAPQMVFQPKTTNI